MKRPFNEGCNYWHPLFFGFTITFLYPASLLFHKLCSWCSVLRDRLWVTTASTLWATKCICLPPQSSYILPTICYFMQVHAPPTTCFLLYATCSLVKTATCFPNYMLPIIFSLLLCTPFYNMPLQGKSYYMLLHALLTTCFLPPSISLTFLFLLLATPIPTH